MLDIKGFIKRVGYSLYPGSYDNLADRRIRESVKFFGIILTICFAIAFGLSIPGWIDDYYSLEDKFDAFDTFTLNLDVKMNRPFTVMNDQIIIDTTGEITELGNHRLLMDENYIHYRLLNKEHTMSLAEYKDIANSRDKWKNIMYYFLVFLMPPLFLFILMLRFVLGCLMALGAFLTGYFLSRLFGFMISKRKLVVLAFHALAIYCIGLIVSQFMNIYYAHYILFAIYFLAAMIKCGDFRTYRVKHKGILR